MWMFCQTLMHVFTEQGIDLVLLILYNTRHLESQGRLSGGEKGQTPWETRIVQSLV
jgi:hypothetical protein